MYYSKESNASYSFMAPNIEKDADKKVETVFPTSELVEPELSSNAATVKVERSTTLIDLGTLSAAATVNLEPGSDLAVGSTVVVKSTSDSTARGVTVKQGSDTIATISGVQSATVVKQLMWTGSTWVLIG